MITLPIYVALKIWQLGSGVTRLCESRWHALTGCISVIILLKQSISTPTQVTDHSKTLINVLINYVF